MNAHLYWTFGYGSIVNLDTWSHPVAYKPAYLEGWKRSWRHVVHLDCGSFSALTLEPCPNTRIAGLLVATDQVNSEILNNREIGYELMNINDAHLSLKDSDTDHTGDARGYTSRQSHIQTPDNMSPIQQSYLDCVMQGYYNVFGESGVIDFMETTDFWDAPILLDRDNPSYPRPIELTKPQLDLFTQLTEAKELTYINK